MSPFYVFWGSRVKIYLTREPRTLPTDSQHYHQHLSSFSFNVDEIVRRSVFFFYPKFGELSTSWIISLNCNTYHAARLKKFTVSHKFSSHSVAEIFLFLERASFRRKKKKLGDLSLPKIKPLFPLQLSNGNDKNTDVTFKSDLFYFWSHEY